MQKNVGSQVVCFQAISSTDGSDVTAGTPAVYYTIDGGAQGTGAGTATHEGNGQWSYVPLQAETNGDHVAFTFVLSGAISQTVNVYPVSFDPTDGDDLGLTALTGHTPQTGDTYALANGAAGFVAIDTVVDSILVDTGTTLPGTLTTIEGKVDTVDTVVDSILDDTGTSGVLLASTATSAQLVDDVWDEALTGATHNVPNSAGRRLRALNDFGLYEGGYVWIDTVNGTAGTTDFENGTVNNPVDSIADALTIAASVGLPGFHLLPGSSITLAATVDNYEFVGHGYTVALGGQSISGCLFKNATITGNDDGTNTSAPTFEECSFTDSTLGVHKLIGCSMGGTTTGITLAEAGTYYWDQCYSGVAGTGTPKVTYGTTNQNLNLRHWSGGIQIENMGASASTDNMSVEGWGQVVEGTCTAGTVAVRGNFTTSGITNLTLSDDARIDVAQINAECDTALTDYDPPTKAEMDTAHSTTDALITGLNDVAATDIVSNGAITTLSGAVVNVDTVDSVTALASNSITSSVIALNAIDSNGLATSAVNEIATGVTTDMDANSTQLAAIVADTGELQGDWADGGRLDLILDARASQASVDALPSAADVLTTAMTESYGTDGAAVTLAEACYVIMQGINEFAISGTTKTVKQLDGTTTAYTSTLDDATSPTSITRAT